MAITPEGREFLDALVAATSAAADGAAQRQIDHREELHADQRSSAKSSSSSDKQYNKQQSGLLKSIVQNISLPLPGGARLFGLSSFMDKIGETTKQFKRGQVAKKAYADFGTKEDPGKGWDKAQAAWKELGQTEEGRRKQKREPGLKPEAKEAKLREKSNNAMTKSRMAMQSFTIVASAAATALTLVVEGLRALGKSLGGVSEGQAWNEMMGAIRTSFTGLLESKFRFPGRSLQMTGAISQEFGQLISSEDAAIMADAVTDFGITTNQMAKLERVFQSTAMSSREAMQSFADVGIVGQVAATELATSAGAVARAGDNFNKFIRDGIKHAKQLGLEFSKMESTLTGFTMDFEGTVSAFSELRAVIPGMATNFGQLLSTAMSGSTDEYIAQIRSSLLGAGIGSATDLNRQQAALLEKATGFSADQIDRILKGEALNAETQEDLTKKSNFLFIAMMGILGALLGATIAGFGLLMSVPTLGASFAIVGGSAAGFGALGAGVGLGIQTGLINEQGIKQALGMKLDDAYITKDGVTQRFSDDDNILLSKSGLGGRGAQMDRLEMKKQTQAIERLVRVMSGPQTITLKNWREAERSAMDASIREA